jgi:hypothetical protein
MEKYPKDETNSKKTEKTHTGKGKKVPPITLNEEQHETTNAR